MSGRSKEELLELAKKYNIDTTNLNYNELSHIVTEKEKDDLATSKEIKELKEQLRQERAKNKQMKIQYEDVDDGREPTHEELMNIPIEVCPHIPDLGKLDRPKYTYEEELGQDVAYRETDYTKEGIPEGLEPGQEKIPLQFEHKGYKKNKVKSVTAGPTSNAGICLYPDEKFFTVYDAKRSGYLWADVRPLLMAIRNGYYYEKYKDTIVKQQFTIYHRYAVPKELIDSIFRDIKRDEFKHDVEEKQFDKFLADQMGTKDKNE